MLFAHRVKRGQSRADENEHECCSNEEVVQALRHISLSLLRGDCICEDDESDREFAGREHRSPMRLLVHPGRMNAYAFSSFSWERVARMAGVTTIAMNAMAIRKSCIYVLLRSSYNELTSLA